MKKLILSLLAVAVMFSANAQPSNFSKQQSITPTNIGYCSGKYSVSLSYPNGWEGKSITIYLVDPVSNKANGWYNTFTLPAKSTIDTVQLPQIQGTIDYYVIQFGSGNDDDSWFGPFQTNDKTGGTGCTLTPVKWAGFSLTRSRQDSTSLTVSWQTLTESNVKSYTLQGSADGGITWDNLTSINPNNNGNSPTSQNYSITYTDPLVATIIEAGFGLLGSLLILGMIVGMISKKHKVIGAVCAVLAIVCMVSCTKSNVAATPKHLKYKMFRVVETDLDGTATYSIVMVG